MLRASSPHEAKGEGAQSTVHQLWVRVLTSRKVNKNYTTWEKDFERDEGDTQQRAAGWNRARAAAARTRNTN